MFLREVKCKFIVIYKKKTIHFLLLYESELFSEKLPQLSQHLRVHSQQ